MSTVRRWLADQLALAAAARMRRRYPDWANAMLNEHANLVGEHDQLGWAAGALWSSLGMCTGADFFYAVAVSLSIAAMTLYEWSADESVVTLAILCLLALGLGFLRPARFLVSGLAVGLVVVAVSGFESVSGIRPAYEMHSHSLTHDLLWLILLVPALASSALGRRIGLSVAG